MRRASRVGFVVLAIVLLAVAAVVFRGPLAGTAIRLLAPAVLGYDVRVDRVQIGTSHAALIGVDVTRKGDPVLAAQRVDLEYHLRDLFPGGTRKFGFVAASISHPVLTLVRHTDGSFNVAGGGGPGASSVPQATRSQARPYYFTVRIRNGVLLYRDLGAVNADERDQSVDDVSLDASIKTDSRSSYRFSGNVRSAPTQTAAVRAYPVRIDGAIDYDRGFAIHHLTAAAVPLRTPLATILHTPAVRIDAGEARALDLRVFAIGIAVDKPFRYHIGGSAELAGGRLTIGAFARPVRDLHGPITFSDDGIATTGILGTIAGVGVRAEGGLFDLAQPTFRLGLTVAGDLHDLRGVFGFAARQPLTGPVRLSGLLESRIAKPLVLVDVTTPGIAYAGVPFGDAAGSIVYYDSAIALAPFHATYGAAKLAFAGRFLLANDRRPLDTSLVLLADAPARGIPYAAEFVPTVDDLKVAALLEGKGTRFRLSGSLAGAGGGTTISSLFAVDEAGYGSYGPLAIDRPGESLVGGVRLDRRAGYDGAWVSAENVHIGPVPPGARFPGAKVPVFPPIAGILDGNVAAAGPPSDLGIAGNVKIADVSVAGIRASHASARLAGSFQHLRLEDIAFSAPFGTFSGHGAVDDQRVALQGRFAGNFDGLRTFTGDLGAHGVVSGPASLVVDARGAVLQLDGGTVRGSVHGVPVDGVSGTIAIDPQRRYRVVAAEAALAGGSAVAAENAPGSVAFSTTELDARRLGLGATLDAGHIDAFGTAHLPQHAGEQPTLDAGFALADGSARGYPVDARASLGLTGDRLTIGGGFAVIAGTEATFDGAVGGIRGTPTYDLVAGVRGGDLGIVRHNVHGLEKLKPLDGSLDADVRVTGRGADPHVVGTIAVPEGSYNGLPFQDFGARIDASQSAVAVRRGSVQVGSTHAQFSAGMAGTHIDATLRSAKADLADFNDYFDTADTLGGTGHVAFTYAGDDRRIRTSADIALANLRYRRFSLGDATVAWHDIGSAGNRLAASIQTNGTTGTLGGSGTLALATGGPARAFRLATVDVTASLRDLDLGVWLPAAGITYPVVGRVNADAHVVGRYPQLAVDSQAHVVGGAIAGVPLQRFDLASRTDNGRTLITEAAVDVPNATLRGTGSFGLAGSSPLDLTFTASAPDVGTFLAQTVHRPLNVAGSLETSLRISGTNAKPAIAAGFDFTNPRIERFTGKRAFGSLELAGTSVRLVDAEIQLAQGALSLSGDVPLELGPIFGIGPPSAPISFLIESRGVDISALGPLFGNDTRLAGTLDGRVGVNGTVAAPRLVGNLALAGGSYVSDLERQQLKDVTASLTFAGAEVTLASFHADAGSGRIDGKGSALLPIVAGSGLTYDLALDVKAAQLDLPQYVSGTFDGTLDIVRSDAAPTVEGAIALTNATIPVSAIYNQNPTAPDPSAPPPLDVDLDLTVAAGKNVRIRNAFIDVGATGDVAVAGTLAAPRLDGDFKATNGTFNILSRAFRVQNANVRFTPDAGLIPQVDLRALARVSTSRDSFDVTTIVTGPSNNLQTNFETDRSYSKDEILAYLSGASALGFNASQQAQLPGTLRGLPPIENALTPPQLVRVPTSAFSLSEAGFDVLNTQLTQRFFSPIENFAANTLGLTSFGVNLDYTGGIGFTARKEVRRNIYLVYGQTVTTPIRENIGLEARPDRNTTIRLTGFTQQGVATYVGSNINPFGTQTYVRSTTGLPIGSTAGFNFTVTRLYP